MGVDGLKAVLRIAYINKKKNGGEGSNVNTPFVNFGDSIALSFLIKLISYQIGF